MKKYFVYLLMLSILVLSALANPSYTGWGYGGYQFGKELSAPDTLWGTNLQADAFYLNADGFAVNNTINNYQMPLVFNPVKSAQTQGNEVYLFDSGSINVFDSNFGGVCSYTLSGWNGTMAVFDNGFNTYLFAYMQKTGTDYNIKILNRSSSCFNLVKSINITDNANYTGSLIGGKDGNVYAWDVNYNITKVNFNGTQNTYAFFTPDASRCAYPFSPRFNSEAESDDYNDDGYDEILLTGQKAGNMVSGIFDTLSESWTTQITTAGISKDKGCYGATAKIGSLSRYIILGGIDSDQTVKIYDLAGNLKLTKTQVNMGVYPIVADINRDGKNEIMFISSVLGLTVSVYSDAFTQIYTVTNVICGASPAGKTANCGFILTGSSWLGISSNQGIQAINLSSATSTKNAFLLNTYQDDTGAFPYRNISNGLWSSGSSVSAFGAIPVAVKQDSKSDFLILGYNGLPTTVIFSSIFGATCGNGVCQSGETVISCPQDCTLASPTSAVLTSVNINPCYTLVWLQNTSLKVTAIAETTDSANVNIYEYIDFGLCSKNDSFTDISSGSSVDFNSIMNCTGTGTITVTANTVNDPSLNTLVFPFTVSAFSGISYGDSVCGITQPLEDAVSNTNTTGTADNAITGTANLFAGMTGLSATVIYIFMMFIVGIACFVFGLYKGMKANLVFMIVIVLETLLLIIGTIPPISIIPIGVLIVLVLVFAVIIAMWLRSIFTGSGDGSPPGG